LSRSHFAVAHGMHNENNYSTAYDMAKLSCLMMKDERFREIVKTIDYECVSTLPKQDL
jgi:serine-type D-Ala-D-Ala carboxypeptidase (penicillin-binding protein 5/6)